MCLDASRITAPWMRTMTSTLHVCVHAVYRQQARHVEWTDTDSLVLTLLWAGAVRPREVAVLSHVHTVGLAVGLPIGPPHIPMPYRSLASTACRNRRWTVPP
jgi:hypothetical protein